MMRNKQPTRLAAEPRPLWQRVIAGERFPAVCFVSRNAKAPSKTAAGLRSTCAN